MKKLFGLLFLSVWGVSFSSQAATYLCKGNYEKRIQFNLQVKENQILLSTQTSDCRNVWDAQYKPTSKYAGYRRFLVLKEDANKCTNLIRTMLPSGEEVFGGLFIESVKVSSNLLKDEKSGELTLVYDVGDDHGRLANEPVFCTAY